MTRHYIDQFLPSVVDDALAFLPPDRAVFALLDLAFCGVREREWLEGSFLTLRLYERFGSGGPAAELSPSLLELPLDLDRRRKALVELCALSSGRPMLSLLVFNGGLDAAYAHLQAQMEARAKEGGFLVRLADTRCLPTWLSALSKEQRERFLAGVESWWYVSREGEFERIGGQGHIPSSTSTRPYDLTAEQCRRLQVAAVPDMIINYLHSRADAFGVLAPVPSQIHASVQLVVNKLDDNSLTLSAAVYRSILGALHSKSLLVPPGTAV